VSAGRSERAEQAGVRASTSGGCRFERRTYRRVFSSSDRPSLKGRAIRSSPNRDVPLFGWKSHMENLPVMFEPSSAREPGSPHRLAFVKRCSVSRVSQSRPNCRAPLRCVDVALHHNPMTSIMVRASACVFNANPWCRALLTTRFGCLASSRYSRLSEPPFFDQLLLSWVDFWRRRRE
jgi:hypothetical protein